MPGLRWKRKAGSEVRAAPPGAGFTRLFGRSVARAFMPGRGRAGQSDKVELTGEDLRNRDAQTRQDPRGDRLPPAAVTQLDVALPVLAQAVDPDRRRDGIGEPDLRDTRFQVGAQLGA